MKPVAAPNPIVGGWTCSACTMVNPASATKCSVCNTPKAKPTITKVSEMKMSECVAQASEKDYEDIAYQTRGGDEGDGDEGGEEG